jgi:hypothetical protein
MLQLRVLWSGGKVQSLGPRRRQLTHQVFNQGVPLSNFNLFSSDPVLKSFAGAFADPAAPTVLSEHGMLCGSEEFMQAAR